MDDTFSTSDLHRLHDTAHRRAEALRRQARDDFWRGTDALITDLATQAVRAADRLAHRLQRHERGCPAT